MHDFFRSIFANTRKKVGIFKESMLYFSKLLSVMFFNKDDSSLNANLMKMITDQSSKFQKCFSYGHFHDCGPSTKPACTDVFATDQLKSNIPIGFENISELDLIMSRCGLSNMNVSDIRDICAKHRYKFGIYYKPSRFCQHPNCSNKTAATKPASLNLSRYIKAKYLFQFPLSEFFPMLKNSLLFRLIYWFRRKYLYSLSYSR